MQPKKVIEVPTELEAQKNEMIDTAKGVEPTDSESIKSLSPDEIDAMQEHNEQEARQAIANVELQEIHDHGIGNPDSDSPWFHPTTNSGHLIDSVFFNHKVVGAPRFRLLRALYVLIILAIIVGLILYKI